MDVVVIDLVVQRAQKDNVAQNIVGVMEIIIIGLGSVHIKLL